MDKKAKKRAKDKKKKKGEDDSAGGNDGDEGGGSGKEKGKGNVKWKEEDEEHSYSEGPMRFDVNPTNRDDPHPGQSDSPKIEKDHSGGKSDEKKAKESGRHEQAGPSNSRDVGSLTAQIETLQRQLDGIKQRLLHVAGTSGTNNIGTTEPNNVIVSPCYERPTTPILWWQYNPKYEQVIAGPRRSFGRVSFEYPKGTRTDYIATNSGWVLANGNKDAPFCHNIRSIGPDHMRLLGPRNLGSLAPPTQNMASGGPHSHNTRSIAPRSMGAVGPYGQNMRSIAPAHPPQGRESHLASRGQIYHSGVDPKKPSFKY